MLSCPTNAKFLLGVGSPHLTSSKFTAVSPQSKEFLQSAAAILANPACTDHALWINQIVLKGCRQRVARDSRFLQDFGSCIRQNASAIPSLEAMKTVDKLMSELVSLNTNNNNNNNTTSDRSNSPKDPWVSVLKILETIEAAANESPEAQKLRECEERKRLFKQANREDLDKVFGQKGSANNANSAKQQKQAASSSNSSSPKNNINSNKTSFSSTPVVVGSNFPSVINTSSSSQDNQKSTTTSTFTVDVHSKINQTNLEVIKATMTSLRDEADELKKLEQNSPTRTLHRDLEKILEEAKTRNGLHLVEKWQFQRDKERGKTGNDYGSLVEDYAWRHSIPFLLMSVCNDDHLLTPPPSFDTFFTGSQNNNNNKTSSSPASSKKKKNSATTTTATSSEDDDTNDNNNNNSRKSNNTASSPSSTHNQEEQNEIFSFHDHQLALGERWKSWTLEQRLSWFERCQTMYLSEEEIEKADFCRCPKCVASGKVEALNETEVAKDAAVTDDDLLTSSCSSNAQKHVESIRRPDRDETKGRERFKLFRRYCWRMKLPFLRLIQNVAYSCPKTKERNAIKGELDGMLVNVCHSKKDGLSVVAIIEVKMNPADLVYARAQREKFVETMRQHGDTMTFSCKSVEDYGRHMSLSRDRFRLFLSDPQRRWIFCTVRNKPDKLSLPFYSKISHIFVRSMAGVVAAKSEEMEQLPVFSFSTKNNNNTNMNGNDGDNTLNQEQNQQQNAGQRRQRSVGGISKEEETMAFQQLRAWTESIRLRYSNWMPTDDECAKVSFSLHWAWEKVVQETGLHPLTHRPLLQSPVSLLEEDFEVKKKNLILLKSSSSSSSMATTTSAAEEAPGNICWIDLPVGATPEQLRREK